MPTYDDVLLAAVLDSPWVAFLGCATVVPLAVWLVRSISWMVMGEMDPLIGIPSIFVSFMLAFVAMNPPAPHFSPLAFLTSVTMVAMYPPLKRHMEKREGIRLEIDQIERAYRLIKHKPDQAYLKFRLAEALYMRGMVAQACALGQSALLQMPKGVFPDEHRALSKWVQHASGSPEVTCLKCGRKGDPSDVFCAGCGAPFLLDYARGKWLGSNLVAQLIAAWALATVGIVGIPFVLSLKLNSSVSNALIVAQIALCGVLVWVGFLKREKSRL